MALSTKDAHMQTLYVHSVMKNFLMKKGMRTTTFLTPNEYDSAPSDCVGLYVFNYDKSVVFAVMADGSINEITEHYFPQDIIMDLERNFKRIINAKTKP
jgi:hypothetical protein